MTTELFVNFDLADTSSASGEIIDTLGEITGTYISANIADFVAGMPIRLTDIFNNAAAEGVYEIGSVDTTPGSEGITLVGYSFGSNQQCSFSYSADADGSTEAKAFRQLYQALEAADKDYIIWIKDAPNNNQFDNAGQLVYRDSIKYLDITTSHDGDDYNDKPLHIRGYKTVTGDLDEGGSLYVSAFDCPGNGQFDNFVELDHAQKNSPSYMLTSTMAGIDNVVLANFYAKDSYYGIYSGYSMSSNNDAPMILEHCAVDTYCNYGLMYNISGKCRFDDCFVSGTYYMAYYCDTDALAMFTRCYIEDASYLACNSKCYQSYVNCIFNNCDYVKYYDTTQFLHCTFYNMTNPIEYAGSSGGFNMITVQYCLFYWPNQGGATRVVFSAANSGWHENNNCAYVVNGVVDWNYASYWPRGEVASDIEQDPGFVDETNGDFTPTNIALRTAAGIWIGAVSGESSLVTQELVDVSEIEGAIVSAMTTQGLDVIGKVLANKAVQDKITGDITHYEDDGETPALVFTHTDTGDTIVREQA